jgi:hypothetical protein
VTSGQWGTTQIPRSGSRLACWDTARQNWIVEKDRGKIMPGASSAGIRVDQTIDGTDGVWSASKDGPIRLSHVAVVIHLTVL